MTTRGPDLLAMIHELTQPTHHHEHYERRKKPRYHVTANPPLLAQLDQSAMPSNTRTDGAGTIAGSRPAANIDAIDTARRIHQDATWWLQTHHLDTTGDTIQLVHRLGPIAILQGHCHQPKPSNHCCPHHDIRRWWTWARITTGWDQPPFQPHNTCPHCGTLGTIRIRLDEYLATCTNDQCRTTWDETTIGLLAQHIRTENGETKAS